MKNMLRLSLLGIIVSFAFCSNRLDGLTIKNGLPEGEEGNEITIMYVVDDSGAKHGLSYFIDIPEGGTVVQPGKTVEAGNLVNVPEYLGPGSKPASFSNLSIKVEYKGNEHEFSAGILSEDLQNKLESNVLGIIFEILTSKDKDYFNKEGKVGKLNARFYSIPVNQG